MLTQRIHVPDRWDPHVSSDDDVNVDRGGFKCIAERVNADPPMSCHNDSQCETEGVGWRN
jgi:hypothetical protein